MTASSSGPATSAGPTRERGGSSARGTTEEDPRIAPLWTALEEVDDPEVPVNVVDLGLICDIRRDGGHVDVDITFTATACPAMDFIREDIRERLLEEPGVDTVEIHVTWEDAWTPDRVSAKGKEQLKRFGITLS